MRGKKILLEKAFEELPKETDFRLEEFEIPPVQDGEFSYEVTYHSVDPYMRIFPTKEGEVMLNRFVVARVLESKNDKFPVGATVVGPFGWVTHGVSNSSGVKTIDDLQGLSPSLLCSALGMPGVSAYFGFLEICCPKPGETVYVNSAAGTVGALVGQIAKIKGCRVVGSAGSEEKLSFLKDIGFDEVFNYKTVNLDEALKAACPDGIDCFFDNVGGKHFYSVLQQMKMNGRVSVCGFVSQYNLKVPDECPVPTNLIVFKMLRVQGFMYVKYNERTQESFTQMLQWIKQGKLQAKEDITEGFENIPKVFIGLFTGKNFGKAVVKV